MTNCFQTIKSDLRIFGAVLVAIGVAYGFGYWVPFIKKCCSRYRKHITGNTPLV